MLKNLKQLREESGVTQKQLADAVAVSQQSINKYENHNIEPDIATLILIADYFHTSVDYLIGHSELRRRQEFVQPYDLTPQEIALLDRYRSLSDQEQYSIRLIMENYRDKDK